MRSARAFSCVLLVVAVGCGLALGSCGLDRDGGAPAETGAGAAASSSSGSGGSGALGPEPCETENDCPGIDTACRWRSCSQNMCQYNDASVGTPCSENGGTHCDGKGNCVECSSASECAPGSCVGGQQTGGETCAGGKCNAVGSPIDCAPYVCDAAQKNCLTDCTTGGDNDCVSGYWCSNAKCVNTKLPDGDPCQSGGECQSGFCVDGVCCGTACTADCQACSAATNGGTDGVCGDALPFTDPHGDCSDAIGCDDAGSCASCGFSLPQVGSCPSACDNCNNNTCNIACPGAHCAFPLTCPSGWDCDVRCQGNNACEGRTINCPAEHACVVHCTDAKHKCDGATINCSLTGPCLLDCQGGDTCKNAELVCGANDCTATCNNGGDFPTVTDNNNACNTSGC